MRRESRSAHLIGERAHLAFGALGSEQLFHESLRIELGMARLRHGAALTPVPHDDIRACDTGTSPSRIPDEALYPSTGAESERGMTARTRHDGPSAGYVRWQTDGEELSL